MFIKTLLAFINIKNMEVTDQIIIDKLTVYKHNKIQLNTCRIKESWLKEHGLYDYMMNRYNNLQKNRSIIQKIVYRIKNHIDKSYNLIYKKRD